jgi:hypothetical protein
MTELPSRISILTTVDYRLFNIHVIRSPVLEY